MNMFKVFIGLGWKYPKQTLTTLFLLFLQNIMEMGTILSIAPIIDLVTHPDLQGITPITSKILSVLNQINLPANIYGIMGVVVGFVVMRALFTLAVSASILNTKYTMSRDMYCNTFTEFFDAGWNFFVSSGQGVIGNTFVNEARKVVETFAQMLMLLATVTKTMIYLIVALLISWKVSVVMALASALFIYPISLLGKITYKLGRRDTETANRIYEVLSENIAAAKVVIGFGEERKGLGYLKEAVNESIKVVVKSQFITAAIPPIFQAAGMIIIVSMLIASLTIIKISVAELAVVVYAFYAAMPLAGRIVSAKNMMMGFFPAYEQLNNLLLKAKREKQVSGSKKYIGFSNNIEFRGVGFSYPTGDQVLHSVNIVIPKGEMIALVGKSGAGKSTLVDLLLRLYDPKEGELLVDGYNLQNYTLHSWRQKVGYVPQDSVLFNMSIRDNLKWSKDDATDEDIADACGVANVDEFVGELPEGLDTIVGDRGVRLSGGQRQRIALARAVLRKPDLLVLDEATASLDSHSEKLIQEAIEKIAHETTVVVVAHRLSTIINSNRIYN